MKKEKVYKVNRPVEFFVPFTKMDEERGIVYGYVTTPALDYDKQKIDMTAFAKALPEYLEYGNIREMHQRKAVGKVLNETVTMTDDGCFLGAKIIPQDVKDLVREGVYSGFSVGLADCLLKTEEGVPNGVITGDEMKIIEISLVDRPANPQARVSAYKVLGGKVETNIFEKYEAITEITSSQAAEKTEPAAQKTDGIVKFTTFSAAWQAGELMDDLPKMVDTLYSVLANIIYSPEGSIDEKKAAMVSSVSEFADTCGAYMTGEKLAKSKRPTPLEICEAAFAGLTADDAKILSAKDAWKKFFVTEVLATTGIDHDESEDIKKITTTIETLKADFDSKLKEATTTIEGLRSEKAELEKRVKKIEESPAPAKAKANVEISTAGVAEPTINELGELLRVAALSGDPTVRAKGAALSQRLTYNALGGN